MCPANGIFRDEKKPTGVGVSLQKIQFPACLVHREVKNQPLVQDFLVAHSSIMSAQSCNIALR